MRKPSRALVIAVSLPFLAGCTATLAYPLPEPELRPATQIHGVVLGDPETGERIEYSDTEYVQWNESSVEISGFRAGEGNNLTTRTYQYSDVGAILVRSVDVNRTSIIIGGVMVTLGVLAAIFYTGGTTGGTVFQTPTPS